jgi:hypothetical protein
MCHLLVFFAGEDVISGGEGSAGGAVVGGAVGAFSSIAAVMIRATVAVGGTSSLSTVAMAAVLPSWGGCCWVWSW